MGSRRRRFSCSYSRANLLSCITTPLTILISFLRDNGKKLLNLQFNTNQNMDALQIISSAADLVTSREQTRAGFINFALEKNKKASPLVAEAKSLHAMAKVAAAAAARCCARRFILVVLSFRSFTKCPCSLSRGAFLWLRRTPPARLRTRRLARAVRRRRTRRPCAARKAQTNRRCCTPTPARA